MKKYKIKLYINEKYIRFSDGFPKKEIEIWYNPPSPAILDSSSPSDENMETNNIKEEKEESDKEISWRMVKFEEFLSSKNTYWV